MKSKTIIKLLLVILWLLVIFTFSSQTDDESSSVSDRFIVKITETISHKKLSLEEQERIVEKFSTITRKAAHMTEYFILAILVYLLLIEYYKIDIYLYLTIILFGIFYATTDEIHQIFVPGRAGMLFDVFIDTCGTFIGTTLCFTIYNLKGKKLKRL